MAVADDGSIPAWAGEPLAQFCVAFTTVHRVYPRVGGGTRRGHRSTVNSKAGLSPRGRGNHLEGVSDQRRYAVRSIPAWAGEPVALKLWRG